MEKEAISKLIIAYAIFQIVALIVFSMVTITGRSAPELVGQMGAARIFGAIAVRNFAIAILLLIGLIHKNPAMLFGGFVVRLATDIGDYLVALLVSGASAQRLVVLLVILSAVFLIPQTLCIRALRKQMK